MTELRRLGALCVMFVSCSSASAQATLTLTPAEGSPFATTDQANATLAVGDLDKEGVPDAVTTVPGASKMTVLLGTATGGLTVPPVRYPTGTNPFDVALADLDGDGDLDAAVADQQDKTVTVYLNNGAGAFTAAAGSPFAAGDFVYSIAAGDFDGDGKVDLVTTQNRGVVVLRNTGAGFAAGTPVPTAQTYGYDVLVTDVNKDGKADVVEADTDLVVLLGDGTGKLAPAPGSPFSGAPNAYINVAAGDLNGDGKVDLAAASRSQGVVRPYIGDGTGGFTAGTAVAAPRGPQGLAIGDVDLDCHADVATSNFGLTGSDTGASILLGDGTGALGSATPVAGSSLYGDDLKLADMNRDGKPDLVIASQSKNVAVQLNGSTGPCAPGASGTPTPAATATPGATATASPTTTPAPPAVVLGDEASAALACTTAPIVLTHTGIAGGKVQLRGAARADLIGKPVQITFVASKKMVAQTTVGTDGTFTATAPVPPKKVRSRSNARYVAVSGSATSPAQKLTRRVTFTSVRTAAGRVTARGKASGAFERGARVKLTQRVSCTRRQTVATAKLGRHGTFTATFAAPAAAIAKVAVYKARTTVISGRKPITTFTLAEPARNL